MMSSFYCNAVFWLYSLWAPSTPRLLHPTPSYKLFIPFLGHIYLSPLLLLTPTPLFYPPSQPLSPTFRTFVPPYLSFYFLSSPPPKLVYCPGEVREISNPHKPASCWAPITTTTGRADGWLITSWNVYCREAVSVRIIDASSVVLC